MGGRGTRLPPLDQGVNNGQHGAGPAAVLPVVGAEVAQLRAATRARAASIGRGGIGGGGRESSALTRSANPGCPGPRRPLSSDARQLREPGETPADLGAVLAARLARAPAPVSPAHRLVRAPSSTASAPGSRREAKARDRRPAARTAPAHAACRCRHRRGTHRNPRQGPDRGSAQVCRDGTGIRRASSSRRVRLSTGRECGASGRPMRAQSRCMRPGP